MIEERKIIQSLITFLEGEKMGGVLEIFSPSLKKEFSVLFSSLALKTLSQSVYRCQRCALAQSRRQCVFGEGAPNALILFVGEAPGEEEDKQGKPFVGSAGILLTRAIEAIGLKREEVYITNVLKCRPPHNRNPLPQEIANCFPYLEEQIRIIQPRIICALGKFAAHALLSTSSSISQLRGKIYSYQGIKLLPTFHPAYLLRNPQGKIPFWEDMKRLKRELQKLL